MKELIKYYARRLSEEIYLKWNCKVMRKRRDGHRYQGVNSPSIHKEFGIVYTYHYIIISHDCLAISSHELALWWEELCLSEPHATLLVCLNVMKKSLHPLVFPGRVRVTEDRTQHVDEIDFLFCLIMWREFWNNTTINNEHKVWAVLLLISHQQTQFLINATNQLSAFLRALPLVWQTNTSSLLLYQKDLMGSGTGSQTFFKPQQTFFWSQNFTYNTCILRYSCKMSLFLHDSKLSSEWKCSLHPYQFICFSKVKIDM